MFEHRTSPLISRRYFLRRLIGMCLIGVALLVISLGIGMAGYHYTEGLPWIDSFANAAMILSGMGPLSPLNTFNGKLFAGSYALFSGLAFISAIGVGIAPIVHRFFHRFHLELEEGEERDA